MRYLYLLLLFSLGALLWAAFAIATHIRRQARQQALLSSVEEHKFESSGLEALPTPDKSELSSQHGTVKQQESTRETQP